MDLDAVQATAARRLIESLRTFKSAKNKDDQEMRTAITQQARACAKALSPGEVVTDMETAIAAREAQAKSVKGGIDLGKLFRLRYQGKLNTNPNAGTELDTKPLRKGKQSTRKPRSSYNDAEDDEWVEAVLNDRGSERCRHGRRLSSRRLDRKEL